MRTQVFEWLVVALGKERSAKVVFTTLNGLFCGLSRVLAYIDDVNIFDSDPDDHVRTISAFFKRRRTYNLKLPPFTARLGTAKPNFIPTPSLPR